jgi:geranylgeranyl pyrophosphate synthase
MRISDYINFILDLNKSELLNHEESSKIDGFDDAILIMDDIKDKSKIRDGKECYYIIHGTKKAKHRAYFLLKESKKELNKVAIKRGVGLIDRVKIQLVVWRLKNKINKGESIDSYLKGIDKVSESLLDSYMKMIRLFTGGHIRHAFELGYLLSNHKFDKNILNAGEKIGMYRQINDDINDYEEKHHEPLGDLINNKNRFPQLVFKLKSSDKQTEELECLLKQPQDNIEDIRKLIFNAEVCDFIKSEKDNIENDLQILFVGMDSFKIDSLKGLFEKHKII